MNKENSITKTMLLAFFKSQNKSQNFSMYDPSFEKALNECSRDYRSNEKILIPKNTIYKDKAVSGYKMNDKKAIRELREKILDMDSKDDRLELLKRFTTLMYIF